MTQLIKRLYESWMSEYDGRCTWDENPEDNNYTSITIGCGLHYHIFGANEGECIIPKPSPDRYKTQVTYSQYEISVFTVDGQFMMSIHQRLSNDAKHFHPIYSTTYTTDINISQKTDDEIYQFFVDFVNKVNKMAEFINQFNDLTCLQEKDEN